MNIRDTPLGRARARRSSGTVADFDGKRLTLARRMLRLQRTTLAQRVNVSAAAITQFEKGDANPTRAVLSELSLALGVTEGFFSQGRTIELIPTSAAHFRSLRATPAISRDQALAFAEFGLAVVDVLEQYVDLPMPSIPIMPVGEDPTRTEIAEIAAKTRGEFSLDAGPLPHIVRLLESRGVVVLRLPDYVDSHVDAFSTYTGRRPLVLLSPVKNDRARSRFDAAHELGHLVMHRDIEPGSKIIENQAHAFASEFLMPSAEIASDLPRRVDWDILAEAKIKWGVSLRALAYRAHELGIWGDLAYKRANQHLSMAGYPEAVPLGPPESPMMVGAAFDLLEEHGTGLTEIAAVSRLPESYLSRVRIAGSEIRPRLSLAINPQEKS
jgi:Zn-dependent peptidase ImmA (M78 family)/transcriptional regulator with XRE-family HTH domain